MLYELSCDKFKNKGEAIRFYPGLNAVIGTAEGGNSIGKSTFLSIIDFVYGGSSYIERHKEIIDGIGDHTFNFAFKFRDEILYFSRGTAESEKVTKWDDSSRTTSQIIGLQEFKDTLSEKYEIPSDASIRGMLNRSFRIWYKEYGINSEKPLGININDSASKSITDLTCSFGLYDQIADVKEAAEAADKKLKALKRTPENEGALFVAKTKTEVKANEVRIKELEKKADELGDGIGVNLNSIDASKLRQISPIRDELEQLQKQKAQIESEIRIIQVRQGDKIGTVDSDYDDLLEFFPDANIASLKEIQSFHKGLATILKKQSKERVESLQNARDNLSLRIDELTREVEAIAAESNVSKTVLREYSSYQIEIDRLKLENSNFAKKEELQKEYDEKKKIKEDTIENVIRSIQDTLNTRMKEIASAVGEDIDAPSVAITGDSKYVFSTGRDKGTGATYRSVIILDLALLSLTSLPAVVHDSVFFNEIEKNVVKGLFEYYDKSSKQIFVAIDRQDADSRIYEIAKKNEVLRLGKSKESLFGLKIQ